MPLWRRRPVPASVRAVPSPAGERRLAWALCPSGEPVVAITLGLVLPGRDRLHWSEIERVVWRRPELTVTEVAQVEGTGRSTTVLLTDDDGDLPAVVRVQVAASVAWTNHLRLSPGGGVRLVGRRQAGEDGLAWQLVYDRGTDPSDPAVRSQAELALLGARGSIG